MEQNLKCLFEKLELLIGDAYEPLVAAANE